MKGWRTIAFNVLTGLILIIQSQGAELWGLSPEMVAFAIVIGNFILRFVTSTPIGDKE